MKTGLKQLIAAANAEITTWSVADARAAAERSDVAFIDIREAEELAREGAIPGSFPAPRGMLEFYADPESAYHQPIFASGKTLLLYCAGGGRSALAAKALQDMGLEKVAHLGGGVKAWIASAGPIEKK